MLEKIEQVVKLIRSKGVGVFFVTQNPRDIPDSVLAQLGNRIQHALRAYTPSERKAVRAAADSFRENAAFDTEEVITDLGTGEALVSTLDHKGVPGVVARTLIRPPASRLGPVTDAERSAVLAASPVDGDYDEPLDRESAYELLEKRESDAAAEADKLAEAEAREKERAARAKAKAKPTKRKSTRQTPAEDAFKSGLRIATGEIVRYVIRGILGSKKR